MNTGKVLALQRTELALRSTVEEKTTALKKAELWARENVEELKKVKGELDAKESKWSVEMEAMEKVRLDPLGPDPRGADAPGFRARARKEYFDNRAAQAQNRVPQVMPFHTAPAPGWVPLDDAATFSASGRCWVWPSSTKGRYEPQRRAVCVWCSTRAAPVVSARSRPS